MTSAYAQNQPQVVAGTHLADTVESDDEDQGSLPRSAPSLRRVCSGKGWVVHGLLFEYSDGVRTGFFGENNMSALRLDDDAGISRRNGVWQVAGLCAVGSCLTP